MRLTAVFLLLPGLAFTAGHGTHHGYRHQHGSCGEVALIRQDNRSRTSRCMRHLENEIKQSFTVDVVQGRRRNALRNVSIDKDMDCNDLINDVACDVEEMIKKKYNRRHANSCILKKSSCKRRTRMRKPKTTTTTSSCGKVALIRQDNRSRTSRCMRHLEHKIEQAFNVDVVQGRRRNALRNVSIDKDMDCNDLINDVACDVEEMIKKKYNRRRANSCILKKSSCKRRTRTRKPKTTTTTTSTKRSAGYGTSPWNRQRHRSCGTVALLASGIEDSRASRCARRIENHIEQDFNVDVVQDERKNALLKVRIDENTKCGELLDDIRVQVERNIKKKFNRGRARSCIRDPKLGSLRTSRSSTSSTKSSKSASTSRSKRSRVSCGAPTYVDTGYPSCQDVEQGGHVNSYWDNPNFLCKTNERPCDYATSELEIRLDNGMVLDLGRGAGGPAEVWQVRTDRYGRRKNWPWNSRYQFFSEDGWHKTDAGVFNSSGDELPDLNNYRFDSLECIEPWDSDDYLFIIVDGVLVDSCPKRIAQECSACNDR